MSRYKILIVIVFTGCVLTIPGLLKPKVVLTAVRAATVAERGAPTIGKWFAGEELDYRIGFWILDDVAVGKLRLESDGSGGYVATLTAHTTGVLGWFLRYRKDTYTARLQEVNGGGRFRTMTFEKNVDIGGKVRRGITVLDYENRLMTWKKWKRGKLRDSGELKMEPGVFYDGPLTAFYNFRFGVYGPIEEGREYWIEGREYWIKTFPKSSNKEVNIYLRLAPKNEFKSRFGERDTFDAYLADVKIDKELFGSKSGDIEILFSDEMVPVEGVAKDILLFGDVRGKFEENVLP
jgi:hypothetical protein